MLSLARSRYTLAAQFLFMAVNAVGVLLGIIYNTSTPDLYPNNAHHKLGWIVTWVVGAQVTIGLLARVAGVLSRRTGDAHERQSFIPVSTEAMAEHESQFPSPYRYSNDSGQGTERHTESLRSHSLSSGADSPPIAMRDVARKEYVEGNGEDDVEAHLPMFPRSGAARSAIQRVAGMVSSRFWKFFMFAYNFIDRTILPLGFIAFCTGVITFGRFFVGTPGIPVLSQFADLHEGGRSHLFRPSALDQRRHFLLAWNCHAGAVVR